MLGFAGERHQKVCDPPRETAAPSMEELEDHSAIHCVSKSSGKGQLGGAWDSEEGLSCGWNLK